jgi:hypothetical protein
MIILNDFRAGHIRYLGLFMYCTMHVLDVLFLNTALSRRYLDRADGTWLSKIHDKHDTRGSTWSIRAESGYLPAKSESSFVGA